MSPTVMDLRLLASNECQPTSRMPTAREPPGPCLLLRRGEAEPRRVQRRAVEQVPRPQGEAGPRRQGHARPVRPTVLAEVLGPDGVQERGVVPDGNRPLVD